MTENETNNEIPANVKLVRVGDAYYEEKDAPIWGQIVASRFLKGLCLFIGVSKFSPG